MDIRDISVGTILYTLAQVPGALLFMGNAYVAQGGGDGEVCGSGVQSSVDVIAKIYSVKGGAPSSLRFTTAGSTTDHPSGAGYEVITGIGPNVLENSRAALRPMVELIINEKNWARIDVYLLTRVCADMRLVRSLMSLIGSSRAIFCVSSLNLHNGAQP